jgi:hypothetical protein
MALVGNSAMGKFRGQITASDPRPSPSARKNTHVFAVL